ncbi:MAG: response regulator [Promethearchaeota archaeon]
MAEIKEKIEKSKEMERYERETGKQAIWRDQITEGFKNWQKGKKPKERINILVSKEKKERWKKLADDNHISTLSKLIKESVEFYVNSKLRFKKLEDFSKVSHKFKEELSSIKGFSQILIEEYKDELSWDILLKLKEIFDKSINMEKLLIKILEEQDDDKAKYDVLIIDDDSSTVYLISEYFKKKGYSYKSTGLGNEVIQLLEKNTPKLILIDILLPDSDGYEICKLIKSNDRFKNIPIYYITAVPESEVKENLRNTGADGYFLKPFDMTQFNVLLTFL